MNKIKLHVVLLDKRNWFDLKAYYDPDTRLAEKRNWRHRIMDRFIINPDHVYDHFLRKRRNEKAVFVDNATRKSVTVQEAVKIIEGKSMLGLIHTERTEVKDVTVDAPASVKLHSDGEIDQKKRNMLDFLIERAFWLSLLEKKKLAITTVLILLLAGIGIYHFLVLFLRSLGVAV
jgi:hypothetical protein